VIYDQIPIVIESQDELGTVKFQVNTNELSGFFLDSTQEIWIEYHNFVDKDPKSCVSMTDVTYPSAMSETFTAKCMHDVPITIVQLWVVDSDLSDADDALVDTCCRKPADITFPQPQPNAVQYTFLLHCESTCEPPRTPAPATTPAKTSSPAVAPIAACTEQEPEWVSNGICQNFAVHARTTVTFDGVQSTIHSGDVGVSPGTSITGSYDIVDGQTFTAGIFNADFAASVLLAYNAAMVHRPDEVIMEIEMGGVTFTPGTYRSGSAINFALATTVTLDGLGDESAEFLFQADSTLVTAADTSFTLINGAKAENIIWALGTAATLGARSIVEGSILAGTAITFGTQSELRGCALAQSAVTFESGGSTTGKEYVDFTFEGSSQSSNGEPCEPATSPSCVETVSHGVCQNFAVHARTTVTFDGEQSTINGGDVGVSPGTSITGNVNIGDGKTLTGSASQDFATSSLNAYIAAMKTRSDAVLMEIEMGGVTFTPGTYQSGSAINFAHGTTVTLDAEGDSNGVFLFQAGTTLVTAADTSFNLIGGAKAENIIWALGSAATLGARSVVEGSIMAGTAITFGTGSSVHGCALAQSAITFESNGSTQALEYVESGTTDSSGTSCGQSPFVPESTCVESVSHGICGNFAVHARTTVTFDGVRSTINGGDVGVSPGTSITGSYDIVDGVTMTGTSNKAFAASVLVAYDAAMVHRQDEVIMEIEIGGATFTPGTYRSGSAINFAYGTTVTLDAQGNSDGVFLFQAGTTLVTAADTSFNLINGARAENIIWALGSAATLGARSVVEGSIMAGTAITFGTGSTIHGCALAQSAVTFESNGSTQALDYDEGEAIDSAGTSCARSTFQPTSTCVESVSHGVCQNYAVHARTAVTFDGVQSTINGGDVGVSPGTSITGSVNIVDGQKFTGTSNKVFAASVLVAYNAAMVRRQDEVVMEIEMGGVTFTPGTYRSGSAINFAHGTTVTLDAEGYGDAVFLFQAGTTLITAADTSFNLINGAKAENIIWALGSAATLGANSVVEGSIMAGTAITFGTGSLVHGCALAQSAVTFESNGSTQALEYSEAEDSNVTSCAKSTFQPTPPCVESVSHGICGNFAVHARTAVSFDGVKSTINGGNVGVSPGTAITGSYDVVDGQAFAGTSSKNFAESVLVAYSAAMKVRDDEVAMAIEMGGLTFTPGTYRSGSAINFAHGTTVTLDAQGNSDGVFHFQAGTTLVTAADTSFNLIGGARAENVIWTLGSAATLGARSVMEGSIIAGTSITVGTGSKLHGCALALAAVTFESNGSTQALDYVEGEADESSGGYCQRNTFQSKYPLPEVPAGGVCQNFAVHARTTVTFDGEQSTISGGGVGVSPGTSITGSYEILDGILDGVTFTGTSKTGTSSQDFANSVLVAYDAAMVHRQDEVIMEIEMGGVTFTPGTYRSGSAINFAHGTTVTLDAQGNADAVFLFQAGTTLVTAADTSFDLIGGAKAENIIWALGSAATLGARSVVEGSIMAGTAITFGTDSELHGCALALSAVTFESQGSVVGTYYTKDTGGRTRQLRG
jgi:hypothetical protein